MGEAAENLNSDTVACPFCAEPVLKAAIKCKHCGESIQHTGQKMGGVAEGGGEDPQRKVGLLLGAGIFLFPYVFSWLTLRKGHSTVARGMAFGWMALLIMVGINGGADSKSENGSTPASQVSSSTLSGDLRPGLNETFRLGDFSYTVTKVSQGQNVGNQFINHKASPGATLILVDFLIKNEGNKTDTVLTDDFKIVDSKGREYRPSSEVTTALTMSGESKNFLLAEVQPGLAKKMKTGFEVPNDSVKGGFSLVIPEKGWGSKKAIIGFKN